MQAKSCSHKDRSETSTLYFSSAWIRDRVFQHAPSARTDKMFGVLAAFFSGKMYEQAERRSGLCTRLASDNQGGPSAENHSLVLSRSIFHRDYRQATLGYLAPEI